MGESLHEIQFYPDPKGRLNFNDFPLGNLRVKVVGYYKIPLFLYECTLFDTL